MTVGNAGPGSGARSVRVVVIDVFAEDRLEMALTEDEQAVEAFAPLDAKTHLRHNMDGISESRS